MHLYSCSLKSILSLTCVSDEHNNCLNMEIRHCVQLCHVKMPHSPKIKLLVVDGCQDVTLRLMEKFNEEKQNKTFPLMRSHGRLPTQMKFSSGFFECFTLKLRCFCSICSAEKAIRWVRKRSY